MIAVEAVFKGRVQGVGFRYTARDIARELGLTGRVKNMPDGSVRLMAEGEEALVEELIARLKGQFMVRECAQSRSTPRNDLMDFMIEP